MQYLMRQYHSIKRGISAYRAWHPLAKGAAWVGLLALICFAQPHIPIRLVRVFLASLFQLLLLGLFAAAILSPLRGWLRELDLAGRDRRRLWRFGAVFCVGMFLFFLLYYRGERDIKVYETALYWGKTIDGRELIARSIPDYILSLRDSLGQDYSDFAVFPLILLTRIFGIQYSGYALSICFAYFLPACFLLTTYALRLAAPLRAGKAGAVSFILCGCICALSADFLWPVLRGHPDAAGVLLMAVMLNITLTWNGADISWRRNIALAALGLALLLTRSWYLHYIVAFLLSFAVCALLQMATNRTWSTKGAGELAVNILSIACLSGLMALVANPDILRLPFSNSGAYHSGNLLGNLRDLAANSGVFVVVFGCAGLFLLCRNEKNRWTGLHLAATAAAATVWFCSAQDMGNQHRYLILPAMLVFTCVLADFAVQYAYKTTRPLLAVAIGAVCGFNFLFAHIPALAGYAQMTKPFTTALNSAPLRNQNVQVLRDLTSDLAAKGTAAYVVGGHQSLSPELLKRSRMPDKTDAVPFVLVNNLVDQRDGFPSQLFLAEYVVLSDPFHPSFETRQQVSYQVYDMLLHDPQLEEYYELDEVYGEVGENVLVFRKTKAADAALVNNLKGRLQAHYPDTPPVFEPDYFLALFQADAATHYEYNHYWNRNILLKKELGSPVEARWNTSGEFATFAFSLSCWEPGLELRLENQEGEFCRQPIPPGEEVPYRFDISGSEFVRMTIDMAEQGLEKSATLILGHQEDGLS